MDFNAFNAPTTPTNNSINFNNISASTQESTNSFNYGNGFLTNSGISQQQPQPTIK